MDDLVMSSTCYSSPKKLKSSSEIKQNLLEQKDLIPGSENVLVCPVTEDSVLISMKSPSKIYFYGILEIKAIVGHAEVLGYHIKPSMPKVKTFSMLGSSALCISTETKKLIPNDFDLSILTNLGLPLMKATQIINFARPTGAVLILDGEAYDEGLHKFKLLGTCGIEVIPKIEPLENDSLNDAELILKCILDYEGGTKITNKLIVDPFWETVAAKIRQDVQSENRPRITLCGGKSVGKTTMARYIVNQLLNTEEKCLYADFDIGQTEFTPPGSLSIAIIDKPLLGPNFTHLMNPLRCHFLGEVDPLACVDRYTEATRNAMKFCWENPDLSNIPWCMNTMGFPTGLGLTLTVSVIQAFVPSILIQLESRNVKQNYPLLTSDFVSTYADETVRRKPNHEFIKCPSPAEQAGIFNNKRISNELFRPTTSRNAMVLSYFGRNIEDLFSQPPFLGKRKRTTSESEEQERTQFSVGTFVALLKRKETDSDPDCVGYGIVRGVDVKTKTFLIITPVDQRTLNQVDSVVTGNIEVPKGLLIAFNNDHCEKIPYITVGESNENVFRPAKRRVKVNWKKHQ